MKLRFQVFDKNEINITDKENWLIDSDGNLYYEVEDVDCPLKDVEFSTLYEGSTYKVIIE